MARYFFHVMDGRFLVDEEGTECLNVAHAREQSVATAGAILKDLGGTYPSGVEWQMHVTDEEKVTLFKLRFSLEELAPVAAPPALQSREYVVTLPRTGILILPPARIDESRELPPSARQKVCSSGTLGLGPEVHLYPC